jgi:hypothetical protein
MGELLSGHPRVCIGRERYAAIFNGKRPLAEALFEKERFLTLQPEDTFYSQTCFDKFHRGFAEKFESCLYVGDKVPCLYRRWDDIFALRPKPFVIFLLRNVLDVAESYNYRARRAADVWPATRDAGVAIREWNTSLRMGLEAREAGHESELLIVEYEGFFQNKARMLGLLRHLGLSVGERDTQHLDGIAAKALQLQSRKDDVRRLTPTQRREALLSAQVGRYRQLLPPATSWRSADFGREDAPAVGTNEAA